MDPERTCVGCRVKRPKHELLRLARTPEGGVRVDPDQRTPGRGAYVCRDRSCIAKATARGALGRALRVPLAGPDLATVREEMERKT